MEAREATCNLHEILPDMLRDVLLWNKAVLYEILFRASAETLQAFARAPRFLGATPGFIGILHTWGQTLNYHVHVHYIVTGGGLSFDGERWVEPKYHDRFLFPVRVLSKVFRGKFIQHLRQAYRDGKLQFQGETAEPAMFEMFVDELARQAFLTYAKPPFAGPEQVIAYIGRYTHRVAITNPRLLDIENGQVRFEYKDYRSAGKKKQMTLAADEFIRRFLLHVLPSRFVRIRHYGLHHGSCRAKLQQARRLLGMPIELPAIIKLKLLDWLKKVLNSEEDPRQCPFCCKGIMVPFREVRPMSGWRVQLLSFIGVFA